jgi:hypothetical protein
MVTLPKKGEPDIDYNASAVSFLREKISIFKYFLVETDALPTLSWYKQEN